MDEEELWTERIRRRESSAFYAYARRMWNYSLYNCLKPADTKVIRSDVGRSLQLSQFFGLAGVIYWNYVAMNLGIRNRWTRVKWSASSYVLGATMSIPWSIYVVCSPMTRAFVSQTTSTTISEWRHPTGLIQHELLPNPSVESPAVANASKS